MVKCEKCGWQPLPESEPASDVCRTCTDFEPGPDGESPLARHDRLGQDHLPLLRRPRQA